MYEEMTDEIREVVSAHLAGTDVHDMVVAIDYVANWLGIEANGDPEHDAQVEGVLTQLSEDVVDEVDSGTITPKGKRIPLSGDVQDEMDRVAKKWENNPLTPPKEIYDLDEQEGEEELNTEWEEGYWADLPPIHIEGEPV